MAGALIPFRNGQLEVSIRDHGYEYDTGAHDIEWVVNAYFPNDNAPANTQQLPFYATSITEEESDYIDDTVREIAAEMGDD